MLIGNRPTTSSGKKNEELLLYEFAPITTENDDQIELWDVYSNLCHSQNPPIPALSIMKPILSGTKFSAKLAHYKIGKHLPIILQMLSQVKNISILNLSDNILEPNCIPHLLEFLSSSDSLSTLNISDNPNLRTKGIKELLDGIGENRSLESIDISNTGCSLIGQSLSKVISNCAVLLRLDAINCDLRNTAIDIANVLPNSEKLKRLNLNNNQLHVGARKLATSLGIGVARCTTLRKLYLSGNAITDDMATVLLKGLSDSTVLTVLDLSKNMIGEASGRAISSFLSRINSLKSFDISNNPILNVTINKIRGSSPSEITDKEGNKKEKKTKDYTPGFYLILSALSKNTSIIAFNCFGLIAEEDELQNKLSQLTSQNSQIQIGYRTPSSRYFNPSEMSEHVRVDSSDDDNGDDED